MSALPMEAHGSHIEKNNISSSLHDALIFAYFTGYFWQKCVSFGKATGYVKNEIDSRNRAVQADILHTSNPNLFI